MKTKGHNERPVKSRNLKITKTVIVVEWSGV